MQTVGVVLLNMGGPENLDAVEPFLVNVFSDRSIIELPFGSFAQPVLARLIAKARGASVRRNYAAIGGGSPQLRLTRAQAAALEARLNWSEGVQQRQGDSHTVPVHREEKYQGDSHTVPVHQEEKCDCPPYRVFTAFRYTRPTAADALEAMASRGIQRVVTVPLYPHYCRATTGSSQADFDRALADPRWRHHKFEVTHLHSYPDDALYLDAFEELVRQAHNGMTEEGRRRCVVLFSAHGLPQKFVDAGDPYVQQIEATRRGLISRLDLPNRQLLAYQSRTGPVRWIGPGTDEIIEELGADGVKHLLIVPLSFVSDHIETLYEIDILFRDAAHKAGIEEYRRPEALNTHPLFIECLARQVEQIEGALVAHGRGGRAERPRDLVHH